MTERHGAQGYAGLPALRAGVSEVACDDLNRPYVIGTFRLVCAVRTVPCGCSCRVRGARTQGWRRYMCTNLSWSGLGGAMTMVYYLHLLVSLAFGWLPTWLMGQRLFCPPASPAPLPGGVYVRWRSGPGHGPQRA